LDDGAGELHTLRDKIPDRRLDVVAHQVQLGLHLAVGRVYRDFCWRESEDQPPSSHIDVFEAQHVSDEGSVSSGVSAEDDRVAPADHVRRPRSWWSVTDRLASR